MHENITIKDLIDAKFTHLSAVMQDNKAQLEELAEHNKEVVNVKLDKLLEHNERQNGWIKKHSEKIEAVESHVTECKKQREHIVWLVKHFYLIVVGIVLISLSVSFSYHHLNINKIKVGPVEMGVEKEPVRGSE